MNECELCNMVFEYPYLLERHKNNKKPCNQAKESTECKICKITFPCVAKLKKHLESKKHINNYDKYISDTNKIETENNIKFNIELEKEKKLKEELQEKHNKKLAEELKTKDELINKLSKENKNLKFDFTNHIKSEIQNEILELIPMFDKITTCKGLNKININEILTQYDKLLSITDLLYVINYDLNKLYFEKFKRSIETKDWIYLDDELINCIGHKEKILHILKNDHLLEDEYIIKNDTCIYLNIECFKDLCLELNTNKSKEVKKYFIEVEQLFKFYFNYTLEYNKFQLEKSKLIKNIYIDKSKLKFNSKLYLITTQAKAKENIFKFGSTVDEKARKSAYNTGHVDADKFEYVAVYECYDAIYLERYIARLLIKFKIPNESELYQLHFNALDAIIKLAINNNNNTLHTINKFLTEDYDNYLKIQPIQFNQFN